MFSFTYLIVFFFQFPVPKCEVVHICVVCSGHASARSVSTLVKSILFYRRHAIR